MPRSLIRLIITIALTALSLILLVWSLWPSEHITRSELFQPAQMQVQGQALPETRSLSLEYPASIRLGDADLVRLDLSTASSGSGSGAGQNGALPNAYSDYTILAEARVDLAGAAVNPPGLVSQALLPGRTTTFFWSLRPSENGASRGTVWFYLHFIPKTGSGQESRRALSAQDIQIQSDNLFGLEAGPARWLGVVGIFISLLLGLPLLDQAQKLIRKRPGHEAGDTRHT